MKVVTVFVKTKSQQKCLTTCVLLFAVLTSALG